VRDVELEPVLADARRVVVAELERSEDGELLLEARPQSRLARPLAREELRVDPPDARVLLQELELLLEVRDVERRARAAQDAAREVAVAEPAVALEVDRAEPALDDPVIDHALEDVLVGQDPEFR
jgi:hypothetical protein